MSTDRRDKRRLNFPKDAFGLKKKKKIFCIPVIFCLNGLSDTLFHVSLVNLWFCSAPEGHRK